MTTSYEPHLLRGHKTAPSNETLEKLGLRPVPLYVVTPNDKLRDAAQ